MGEAGPKMRSVRGATYTEFGHWCPGCDEMHVFAVEGKNHAGASWTFDGNLEKPTFDPSMNITVNGPGKPGYDPAEPTEVCHYFLQAGELKYLNDCTHKLKNKTVSLPDLPEHMKAGG